MVGTWFFPADPKRISGVQVENPMVLHINLWDTIVCGWQKETVIKADFERPRFQVGVPCRPFIASQAEVPLADHRSMVPSPFQKPW